MIDIRTPAAKTVFLRQEVPFHLYVHDNFFYVKARQAYSSMLPHPYPAASLVNKGHFLASKKIQMLADLLLG